MEMTENEDNLNSGKEILIDDCNFSFFSRKWDVIPSEEEVYRLEEFLVEIPDDDRLLLQVYPVFCSSGFALVGKRFYAEECEIGMLYYQHEKLMNDFLFEIDKFDKEKRERFNTWADKARIEKFAFSVAGSPIETYLIPEWLNSYSVSREEEVLKCFPAFVKTNGLYFDILTKKIRKRCRFNLVFNSD